MMTELNSWGQGPVQHLQHPTEMFDQTGGAGIAGVCITLWYHTTLLQTHLTKRQTKEGFENAWITTSW